MNVGSLEKRSNQLKYEEPNNEKSNDYCKADHNNVYAFSQQYSEYSAGHTTGLGTPNENIVHHLNIALLNVF